MTACGAGQHGDSGNEESAKKRSPGPDPETLKLSGDWEDRVGDALAKPRPPEGWPERPVNAPIEREKRNREQERQSGKD